ncbi:hypothetical protein PIB30_072977, partial [Stylosanthes scabra]|nr:hypothetical protein [Stylosanthes scabra]
MNVEDSKTYPILSGGLTVPVTVVVVHSSLYVWPSLTMEVGSRHYYTSIKMGLQYFNVVDINPKNHTMKLVLGEGHVCLPEFKFSLSSPFMYNQSVHNITLLYNCTTLGVSVNKMGCPDDGYDNSVVYYNNTEHEMLKQHSELKNCHLVQLPAEIVWVHHDDLIHYPPYFGKGLVVNYSISKDCVNCMVSGGVCGSNDDNANQFACYYPHK